MKRIKSLWLTLVIFLQKMYDIAYRWVKGNPALKRSQVTAHLFLGGQYNLRGLHRLKQMGITAIINMRIHSVFTEAQYAGIRYLHLPTEDNTAPALDDLIKGADFACTEITNGGKVYIHCRQGLGRGPSMAIAYLLKMGATYDDAFRTVQKVRPFIHPRPAQVARLKEMELWLKEHHATVDKVIPKT